MKLILLISVFAFGVCSADYSKAQVADIMEIAKKCYKELGIPFDSDLVERIMYNQEFSDDITTKKFINCGLKGLNLWESEGVIDRDGVVTFMARQYDPVKVRATTDKCYQPTGATQDDKAYNWARCFFKNMTFKL